MLMNLIISGVIIAVLIAILGSIAAIYRKVGPNEALIIYGVGQPQVVIGGGAMVIPLFRMGRTLSLALMSFDVRPDKELYTHQGVAVLIEAVTQLKVKSDQGSIMTAAEQFLDKPSEERDAAIRLVMEGHLRGIVGQLTVEQIVKEPEMLGDKVRSTCAADLAKMGLEMISFTIKDVADQNDYIKNMGLPNIEQIKKEANIAAANAQRDTDISRANAMREAAIAKAKADQERVIAETASQAKQAEAQRDLEIKRAEYEELVQRQKATADKAYEIQASVMQQQVVAEQVKIQQVERTEQVKVQEAEILRREKELIATDLKAAEVEGQRRQTLAEAEKQRQRLEAEGQAEAIRQKGEAEAQVLKVRGEAESQVLRIKGEAEASIIKAKGEAEASAMDVRAQAYKGYNEAAVLDKLLTSLPEIVHALSEPLSKVDKITVISTGDGNGSPAGVNKITADVAKMVAQVPALVESLSGISVADLLKTLPKLGDAIREAEGQKGEPRAVGAAPKHNGQD
jgi:flotillin